MKFLNTQKTYKQNYYPKGKRYRKPYLIAVLESHVIRKQPEKGNASYTRFSGTHTNLVTFNNFRSHKVNDTFLNQPTKRKANRIVNNLGHYMQTHTHTHINK